MPERTVPDREQGLDLANSCSGRLSLFDQRYNGTAECRTFDGKSGIKFHTKTLLLHIEQLEGIYNT